MSQKMKVFAEALSKESGIECVVDGVEAQVKMPRRALLIHLMDGPEFPEIWIIRSPPEENRTKSGVLLQAGCVEHAIAAVLMIKERDAE